MIDYRAMLSSLGCDVPFDLTNEDILTIVRGGLADRLPEDALMNTGYGSVMHMSGVESLRLLYILQHAGFITVCRLNVVEWLLILVNVVATKYVATTDNAPFDYDEMVARINIIYNELCSPPGTKVTPETILNANEYLGYSKEMRRRNNIKPIAEF